MESINNQFLQNNFAPEISKEEHEILNNFDNENPTNFWEFAYKKQEELENQKQEELENQKQEELEKHKIFILNVQGNCKGLNSEKNPNYNLLLERIRIYTSAKIRECQKNKIRFSLESFIVSDEFKKKFPQAPYRSTLYRKMNIKELKNECKIEKKIKNRQIKIKDLKNDRKSKRHKTIKK